MWLHSQVERASEVAVEAHQKHEFTDVSRFSIMCLVCRSTFVGQVGWCANAVLWSLHSTHCGAVLIPIERSTFPFGNYGSPAIRRGEALVCTLISTRREAEQRASSSLRATKVNTIVKRKTLCQSCQLSGKSTLSNPRGERGSVGAASNWSAISASSSRCSFVL
jgi:hypothetical protein